MLLRMSIHANRFLFGLLLVLGVATVGRAQGKGAIRTLLLERDKDIKTVLSHSLLSDDDKQKLRGIVNDLILFEEMGKTALGDYWADLTDAQRKDFVDTFSGIVREQSLADLDPYRAQVTVGDIEINGSHGRASTTALYKDVSTVVEYDLLLKNGQWWITDISLDGVSTADGYARSFQTAIRKRGFDGLMKSLNKRLEKIKS